MQRPPSFLIHFASVFLCLLLCASLRAQQARAPFIKSRKIYDCHESQCGPAEIQYRNFENGVLHIKHVIRGTCDNGPDTVAFDLHGDTVKLYAFRKEALSYYTPYMTHYLKKGPTASICACRFIIEMEIAGLTANPKYVMSFTELYSQREEKFVSIDWYNRTINRNWENNSALVNSKELTELLGAKWNSLQLAAFYKKMGNDSIWYDELRVIYEEDGLELYFTPSGNLRAVEININYKGTLPGSILWSDTKEEVERKLGKPTREDKSSYSEYDPNVGWQDHVFEHTCYFEMHKLFLKFDEGKRIIELRLQESPPK